MTPISAGRRPSSNEPDVARRDDRHVAPSRAVLIVEDDEATAELQRRRLQRAGYTVFVAGDLDSAVERLQTTDIALAVVDYRLKSNYTGLDLYAELKDRGLESPTILVTGFSNESLVVEALRAGVRDFVPKTPDYLEYLVHAVRKVLDKAETEQRLIDSEARKSAMIESALDAVVSIDESGMIVEFNPAAEQTFGYTQAEAIGSKLADLLVPDAQRAAFERHLHDYRGGESKVVGQTVEMPAVKADGTQLFVEISVSAVRQSGRWLFTAYLRDLTRRKQAARQRDRLAGIVESSQDAIIGESLDGTIIIWNAAAERMLGYRADEVIGRNRSLIVPEDDRNNADNVHARIARRERIEPFGADLLTKDGRRVPVSLSVSPVKDESGEVVGTSLIARDVSERRRMETRLRLRERALEGVSQGIFFTDPHLPDNPIVYVNPAFEKITGFQLHDLKAKSWMSIIDPAADAETVADLKRCLETQDLCTFELLQMRAEGKAFWSRLSIAPLHDDDGRLTHFVGIFSDVTERRLLEEQMRQSYKMEAIGRLAGGVAHDFNNILTIILGNASDALGQLTEQTRSLDEPLNEIMLAAERAAALTKQLLAFSRKQISSPRAVQINDVVANLDKMMRRLIGEDMALVIKLDARLGAVNIDPAQVEQILLNLAVNARDAMPGGGTLLIETANVELDQEYVRLHPDLKPGMYAKLSVSDTGTGIEAADLPHVFEPFFTTKQVGKGTGMGLATVFGIVRQAEGHVNVYSEPGHGATFNVYLPQVDGPAATQPADAASKESFRGTETILLVEDEEPLRRLAKRMLTSYGYRVLEADSGAAAVEIARRNDPAIDLLITDVVMPGQSGRQIVEEIAAFRPGLRALYISGYTNDAVVQRGVVREGAPFLQKPFTPTALAERVRQVLDAETHTP